MPIQALHPNVAVLLIGVNNFQSNSASEIADGKGAIGFSPFGIDYTGWTRKDDQLPEYLSENFALFLPMDREIAQLDFEGKLQTDVEQKGASEAILHF